MHAIAFVATVVDRDGKQVAGLGPGDFVIRDEGKPVTATVRQSVTAQLLDIAVTPKDKVFIVAFDAAPWLLHPPRSDLASLKKAVLSLRPSGMTATVDGVAFGLQQFSGTTGKRALVVITDGREGASSQTAEAAIHLAKDTGIPVYGIVTWGQQIGNPLVNIAAATRPAQERHRPDFRQISDEVRGQYLISFVAQDRGKAGEWRRLTVEVPRREAKVRTVSGYFAR